jgi:hypothetical protein
MPSQSTDISLRVRVTPALYGRIGDFRHEARLETRNAALVTLLNAGLAALAKPPALPQPKPVEQPRHPKLVAYAGK